MKYYEPAPDWDNDDGVYDPELVKLIDRAKEEFLKAHKPISTPFMDLNSGAKSS